MKELKWAVLGAGTIANEMADAFEKLGRRLYGVYSRTAEKAEAFAEKYGVQKVFSSFQEMCEDEEADIIYVATPHNTHYPLIREALLHGKHVLAEKSITLNSRELEDLCALAKEKDKILAEAMTVWHMPLIQKLWEVVESGALGKVQMITLNFGSFKEYDMSNRFFNPELAGGALLDIGVYALSIVRSFMEENPDRVVSHVKRSPAGSDEQVTMLLMNHREQMATVALSLHSRQPKRAMISCEKAYIEIMEYPRAMQAEIVEAVTGKRDLIECGRTQDALQYEVADMEEAVRTGDPRKMKLDFTCDVSEIMTKLRKEWKLQYPGEIW